MKSGLTFFGLILLFTGCHNHKKESAQISAMSHRKLLGETAKSLQGRLVSSGTLYIIATPDTVIISKDTIIYKYSPLQNWK